MAEDGADNKDLIRRFTLMPEAATENKRKYDDTPLSSSAPNESKKPRVEERIEAARHLVNNVILEIDALHRLDSIAVRRLNSSTKIPGIDIAGIKEQTESANQLIKEAKLELAEVFANEAVERSNAIIHSIVMKLMKKKSELLSFQKFLYEEVILHCRLQLQEVDILRIRMMKAAACGFKMAEDATDKDLVRRFTMTEAATTNKRKYNDSQASAGFSAPNEGERIDAATDLVCMVILEIAALRRLDSSAEAAKKPRIDVVGINEQTESAKQLIKQAKIELVEVYAVGGSDAIIQSIVMNFKRKISEIFSYVKTLYEDVILHSRLKLQAIDEKHFLLRHEYGR